MKIKINKNPKFTAGISYDEHIKKAQQTFDTVVKPQVASEISERDQKAYVLTPAQKAYLNCLNPI